MKHPSKTLAIALAASFLSASLGSTASASVPGQNQLRGRITAFNGGFDLHVQTRRGEIDDVTLHHGTIINPTGLTLRPGMRVTILGTMNDGSFDANEVDTPYHEAYVPVPQIGFAPAFFGFGNTNFGGFDYPYYVDAYDSGSFTYAPVYLPENRHDSSKPSHG